MNNPLPMLESEAWELIRAYGRELCSPELTKARAREIHRRLERIVEQM